MIFDVVFMYHDLLHDPCLHDQNAMPKSCSSYHVPALQTNQHFNIHMPSNSKHGQYTNVKSIQNLWTILHTIHPHDLYTFMHSHTKKLRLLVLVHTCHVANLHNLIAFLFLNTSNSSISWINKLDIKPHLNLQQSHSNLI